MNLKALSLSARSFSFEIEGSSPYEAPEAYEIKLNGRKLRRDARRVQTLFGLEPGADYRLEVIGTDAASSYEFITPDECLTLNVRDFGAKGDGLADDTQAIQAALYSCPRRARVLVPAGRYRITSLFFKSHTRFELAAGAVLEAIPGREGRAILPGFVRDYRKHEKFHLGSWEGNPLDCFAGILNLIDVDHVTIYGEGMIEGGGSFEGWWADPKKKIGAWRPRSIFMRRCRKISVLGITVKNSPSWTIHPMDSKKLDFINVSIQNPWDSPNTDGINPESCSKVRILGCRFSLGDDCIALKSGKIYMAQNGARPSRGIEIRNCLMEDGHGAVTIGSEMAGGVRDVEVEKCIFRRTDRGLRIKTRRGRGEAAEVSGIHFKNIVMEDVVTPFVINMFYFCDPDGHSDYVQNKQKAEGPAEALPTVGALAFEDIRAENCGAAGVFAYGLPERPIESLSLKNVSLSFAEPAKRNFDVQPAMLDDNDWQQGDLIYVKNVGRLSLDGVTLRFAEGDAAVVENCGVPEIKDSSLPPFKH